MNDEEKTVGVHADRGTQSLGKSAYFAAMVGQFNKKASRYSVVIVFGLTALIFVIMMISNKKPRDQKSGKPLQTPGISRDDPILTPKLKTDRDLTNFIKPRGLDRSILGKIKVVSLRSISEIPTGSEVKAMLESGATDGMVKARITEPLLVDGEPILPQNSVLFGKGKSGDERLMVEFVKIIFPTGESFPIKAEAFDSSDKILGLKGAIVGSRTKKMAGAMAFGFLGGMADGLQDTSGMSMFYGRKPSVKDAALSGTSKAMLDQSQIYLEELKRSPNIIHVKAGENIVVIFDDNRPSKKSEE